MGGFINYSGGGLQGGNLQTQTPGVAPMQMPAVPGMAGGAGGPDFEALLKYKMGRQAQQDRDAREMRQIALIQQGKDADFQDQQRELQLQQQRAQAESPMERQLRDQQLLAETKLKQAAAAPMPRSVQGFGFNMTPGYMTDYSQVPQALLPKESTMHHGEADTIASVGGYGSPSPDVNALPYGLGVGKDPRSPNFGAQTIDTGEGAGGGAGPSPQEAARRAGIGLVPAIEPPKKPGRAVMPNYQQEALSGQYGSGTSNTGVQTPSKKKKSNSSDINTSTQNDGPQAGYNDETYNKGLVSTAGGYHRLNMGKREE